MKYSVWIVDLFDNAHTYQSVANYQISGILFQKVVRGLRLTQPSQATLALSIVLWWADLDP